MPTRHAYTPFRLTVDTTESALSPELEIHISYGGDQTETYHPGQTSQSSDICCATYGVGGTIPERIPCAEADNDAAAGRALVVCDLWTGGAANLTIRNGAEVVASQTLQATPRVDTPQQCGLFETLDAHWTYGLADAGVAVQD